MSYTNNNISFSVIEEDILLNETELDLSQMFNYLENNQILNDDLLPQIINYHENFTIKELFVICEYYGLAKELKSNKCNKEQIINFLVVFETNPNNSAIVFRRQNMWFYINELKNDKFMKKYVLW